MKNTTTKKLVLKSALKAGYETTNNSNGGWGMNNANTTTNQNNNSNGGWSQNNANTTTNSNNNSNGGWSQNNNSNGGW